jgi:microsomal dipeptidase-like Zn-dependent dipeptidase
MASGFADIHNHQCSNLGFGGAVMWGSPYGPLDAALPPCDLVHGPAPFGLGGALDVIGNVMKMMYYGAAHGIGHHHDGSPTFAGWPRWDSITHQAVHEDMLFRAVQGGLRLMTMYAVNNEFMCGIARPAPGFGCTDMEAVDRQLQCAKDMEASIDAKAGGPGQGWYRIVRDPVEAKAAIAAGKLAVVLGIEVDYLFGAHTEADLTPAALEAELDKYYALGVRQVFPIHFGDNGFGGAAFQNGMDRDANGGTIDARNPVMGPILDIYPMETEDATAWGYQYRTGRRNRSGLTSLGKLLINGLIKRRMIIDVDHMSARSKADVFEICEAAMYPGVVASHIGLTAISNGEKNHEGQLLPAELDRIRDLGGMVGVILHQGDLNDIRTWPGPGTSVPHVSGNTSNTVVQAYLGAVAGMRGGPVAFGTDFNGFAGLPGPRFGADASPGGSTGAQPSPPTAYPFTAIATGGQMGQGQLGQRVFDINTDGPAHVGMLPDLIADFSAQGLTASDLAPLLNSADGFAEIWRQATTMLIGFGGHEIWSSVPFYGSKGTFFADVTGNGKADAIAVNDAGITVRRSTGTNFGPNEDWSHGPFFGNIGTYFADVDGDGKADVIAVNTTGITVRLSTGSGFGPPVDYTSGGFYGDHGTFFADVTGTGRVDAIAVNGTGITVRRHSDAVGHFANPGAAHAGLDTGPAGRPLADIFGPNEDWSQGPFFGTRGTFFANITGDGRAAAIAVNDGTITVRRSTGSGFGPPEDWTRGPFYGNRDTFFVPVAGSGTMADAIVVNDTGITVRITDGTQFRPGWNWTDDPYYGTRGTFFADVAGTGHAAAIVVNDNGIVVRQGH